MDGINEVSVETMPILEFLTKLFNLKRQEDTDADLALIYGVTADTRATLNLNENPLGYADRGSLTNMVTNDLTLSTATLSGGVLANHILYSPSATRKGLVTSFHGGSTNTTTLDLAFYNGIIHEEDQAAANRYVGWGQMMFSQKHWVNFKTSVAVNKDILIDLTGVNTAGNEILCFATIGGDIA